MEEESGTQCHFLRFRVERPAISVGRARVASRVDGKLGWQVECYTVYRLFILADESKGATYMAS